jgi:hypothetical protein
MMKPKEGIFRRCSIRRFRLEASMQTSKKSLRKRKSQKARSLMNKNVISQIPRQQFLHSEK